MNKLNLWRTLGRLREEGRGEVDEHRLHGARGYPIHISLKMSMGHKCRTQILPSFHVLGVDGFY